MSPVRHRPLIPFLGAGVMAGAIPQWDGLLRYLLEYAIDWRFSGDYPQNFLTQAKKLLCDEHERLFTIYEQASIVKRFLGKQYLGVLRDMIYSEFLKESKGIPPCYFTDWSAYLSHSSRATLNATVKLCALRCVGAMITYNYDDIVFHAVCNQPDSQRGVHAVYGQAQANNNIEKEAVPVDYVHGHLPCGNGIPSVNESSIILSQDEYLLNMMQPFSWQTNIQLHYLMNATCLFIGTSLRDINMLRVLFCAKEHTRQPEIFVLISRKSMNKAVMSQTGSQSDPDELVEFLMHAKSTALDEVGARIILAEHTIRLLASLAT